VSVRLARRWRHRFGGWLDLGLDLGLDLRPDLVT
jgi:hypothetical protein